MVGFVESGGARLQEGHAALAGYGRIFRASVELSARVPQISIVTGVSAGGGAYSPALTDFVVMTEEARMFLTGPQVVEEALGEEVSMEDLGGPRRPRRATASASWSPPDAPRPMARDPRAARPAAAARSATPRRSPPPAAAGRRRPDASVPAEARKVYDVRDVAARDRRRRHLLELSAALGAEHGHRRWRGSRAGPVGVIANQPRRLGGVIDAAAAEKAALFVDVVRPLRAAAGRPRRHARASCPAPARRRPG